MNKWHEVNCTATDGHFSVLDGKYFYQFWCKCSIIWLTRLKILKRYVPLTLLEMTILNAVADADGVWKFFSDFFVIVHQRTVDVQTGCWCLNVKTTQRKVYQNKISVFMNKPTRSIVSMSKFNENCKYVWFFLKNFVAQNWHFRTTMFHGWRFTLHCIW